MLPKYDNYSDAGRFAVIVLITVVCFIGAYFILAFTLE